MSKTNIELARRGYEALMRGDFEALAELMDPDLTWHWWEHGPWDCHSREEALGVIKERLGQGAIGELREVIDLGEDRVLVVVGRPAGAELDWAEMGLPEDQDEMVNLVTFRGHKVVALHDYRSQAEAMSAVRAREG